MMSNPSCLGLNQIQADNESISRHKKKYNSHCVMLSFASAVSYHIYASHAMVPAKSGKRGRFIDKILVFFIILSYNITNSCHTLFPCEELVLQNNFKKEIQGKCRFNLLLSSYTSSYYLPSPCMSNIGPAKIRRNISSPAVNFRRVWSPSALPAWPSALLLPSASLKVP